MILGLLVRLLINVHFAFFLVGTFISSLGFCFMINSANKFVNVWFPAKDVFMMNSLCVFSLFASDALGVFCSAIFIDKSSTK